METYFNMTIAQLKEEAKTRGIKGVSAMKKQELAELLLKEDQKAVQKKAVQEEKTEKKNAERTVPVDKPAPVDKTAGEAPRYEAQPERKPVRQNAGGQERPSGRPQNQRTAPRQEYMSGRPQSRNTGAGQERLSGRPQIQGMGNGQERPAGRPQVQIGNGQERLTGRPQSRTTGMGQERTSGRMVQQPSGEGASNETSYQPRFEPEKVTPSDIQSLDSGETRSGILEVMPENFGFIRCDNYLPGRMMFMFLLHKSVVSV